MVIWLTGMSGVGKTTIADALKEELKGHSDSWVFLDGDVIREVFGGDLGYKEADRVKQISRIQRLAYHLSLQGVSVVVSALYCNPDLLQWNRENIKNYFEVYLKASMDLLKRRDQKGLYSKFERGETKDIVGLDIPWHEPKNPDLVIEADQEKPPVEFAQLILSKVGGVLSGAR